ncbi:hypothetical protein LJR225_002887 [Phenylobacterium sp. LjRoot225]|uniref:hypothetical protein n=1 Tax=Phenylobacterium sp. LjRoot225 TaxID=3342285 RepID=UPI003ECCF5BA
MPTQRGFIEKLEIGRQGLVVFSLLHDDGSQADYRIPDLDADPERFNERLSKLAILRDAMDSAEPVEVEFETREAERVAERVARITRDGLDPAGETRAVSGLIVGVSVNATNRTGARGEAADLATIVVLGATGGAETCLLDLQNAERGVAQAQLDMIREAQASGQTLRLGIDEKTRRIKTVSSGGGEGLGGGGEGETLDGFVETVAHAPGAGGFADMAIVELTTAPPFSGAGNTVELLPFTPEERRFLVVIGSVEYELVMAALRDKLRLRIVAGALGGRTNGGGDSQDDGAGNDTIPRVRLGTASMVGGASAAAKGPLMLVRGAQLLHALASASRPVWIQVSRKSLDVGPEAACTEGLPSSDLTPRTLRDLHLPYKAAWMGLGCFNHGVYRFQFAIGTPFAVEVDGEPLCVHASSDGATQFAHACLDGEHEVKVVLDAWTCDQAFNMDLYRIR